MDCRNENGYCQKIHDKVGREIMVDDRGCAKCNGNPKMPGEFKPVKKREPIRDEAEQERVWQICCQCDDVECPECGVRNRVKYGHCPENKWSK